MTSTSTRRRAVVTVFLLLASWAESFAAESERPIVGAWRWDAWYGEGEPADSPESTLGPPKYHFRLPWFAKPLGGDKVQINGDSQEIIEQELAYAAEAGLDYWMFLEFWDQEHPDYTIALKRYRAAKNKRGIRYCLASEDSRLDKVGASGWPRLIEQFKDPNYQMVLNGRPLFFIFRLPKKVSKSDWRQLGNAAVAAGLKRPYLVLMSEKPEQNAKDLEALGLDAMSAFGIGPYSMKQPSYAELCEMIRRDRWEKCRELRIPSVTFASSGWDTRPRNERPPTWATSWLKASPPDKTPPAEQKPLIDAVTATPEELAAHIRDAVAWTQQNRDINPSNTILIYGWNENDEGGWLIPTLGADGRPNEERIKALGKVLRGK
jgi:hypothetical protein